MKHQTPESRLARVLATEPPYMTWGGNPPDPEALQAWLQTHAKRRAWQKAFRALVTYPDLVFAVAVNEAYLASRYRDGHDVIGPRVKRSRAGLKEQLAALAAVQSLRDYFQMEGVRPMRYTVGPFGIEMGGRGSILDQLDCVEQAVRLSARDAASTMAQAGPFVFIDKPPYTNRTRQEDFAINGLLCRLASLFHWAAAGSPDDAWGFRALKNIDLGQEGRGPLIETLVVATFADFEPDTGTGKRVRDALNRKSARDARLTRWPVDEGPPHVGPATVANSGKK